MPSLLAGEHILSTIARWAKLQGENDTKRVLNRLSDHMRGFNPSYCYDPLFDDFMCHFGPDSDRKEIVKQQTMMMYHSALINYNKVYPVEHLKTYYPGCSKPKFPKQINRLPVLTIPQQSKLAFSNVWRWCEQCASEDKQKNGVSYWHVAHQIPSTFTCYKHPEQTLIEVCDSCGFQYTDIREYSSPPEGVKCPNCTLRMLPYSYISNEHTDWLSKASFQLLNQSGGISTPIFGHAMKNGLSHGFSKRNSRRARESIFVADELQSEFNEWLFNHHLDVFFKEPELAVKEKVLSIDVGRIQARRLPPISVLLWLRFFGAESLESHCF